MLQRCHQEMEKIHSMCQAHILEGCGEGRPRRIRTGYLVSWICLAWQMVYVWQGWTKGQEIDNHRKGWQEWKSHQRGHLSEFNISRLQEQGNKRSKFIQSISHSFSHSSNKLIPIQVTGNGLSVRGDEYKQEQKMVIVLETLRLEEERTYEHVYNVVNQKMGLTAL